MAYLIEPTNDLHASWLAAQREHHETDGHTEAWGLSLEDLEDTDDAEGVISAMRGTQGTDPGLTREWWWVEESEEGALEYIGRVELQPDPGPQDGHLRVAVRPTRRRQGHGTELLRAALTVAAGRGLPSVVLACPEGDVASHELVRRVGGSQLTKGAVDRFNVDATTDPSRTPA